jgi:hypothetical protein
MTEAKEWKRVLGSARYLLPAVAVSAWLAASTAAFAQSNGCSLVADDRNPSEKILRCGKDLTIRTAPGTRPALTDKQGQAQPADVQLDSGALMIEFNPTDAQRSFQILTPHAIAAVRGTKWVVEVTSKRTATLVISGVVEVGHRGAKQTAKLRAGEGADISSGTRPIVVKRWPRKRVSALLARFGE